MLSYGLVLNRPYKRKFPWNSEWRFEIPSRGPVTRELTTLPKNLLRAQEHEIDTIGGGADDSLPYRVCRGGVRVQLELELMFVILSVNPWSRMNLR